MPAVDSEYERGVQDQRLEGHDVHFEKINGSQADAARDLAFLKTEMTALRMDLQRLTDAVNANQKTVATTALAVESERRSTAEAVETQRTTIRDSAERRWSPLSRMVGLVSVIGGLAAFVTWLISLRGH
jgi:hypothetical protein